jgi:hypothetical protein
MFVRFQRQGARLHVRLIQTRRISGKVQSEYVGALGSVDAAVSVRERLAFWGKLPQRLAALGNRVGPDEHAKIISILDARIPMVTQEDLRAVQEENAKDDEKFWDAMHGMNAASTEEHKLMIASAEAKRKEHERLSADAAEKREVARERLAKLARGETVAGGLGKKLDMAAVAKAAGLTARDIRRARLYASLNPAEFETALDRAKTVEAADTAMNREVRRVLRERWQ